MYHSFTILAVREDKQRGQFKKIFAELSGCFFLHKYSFYWYNEYRYESSSNVMHTGIMMQTYKIIIIFSLSLFFSIFDSLSNNSDIYVQFPL